MFEWLRRKKKLHGAYRTTNCTTFGHREITIQLRQPPPIEGVHRHLLTYFEQAVANGTVFRQGETVQFGWSTLRICEGPDKTLGVEERELDPEGTWTQSVDRALRDIFFQLEVGKSVGLQDALCFPRQDQLARVQPCIQRGAKMLFMRLPDNDLPAAFSGWSLRCQADHPHEEADFCPLLAIASLNPELVQFLALPHDSAVLVQWKETPNAPSAGLARVDPQLFLQGQPLAPVEGSYLAMLSQF